MGIRIKYNEVVVSESRSCKPHELSWNLLTVVGSFQKVVAVQKLLVEVQTDVAVGEGTIPHIKYWQAQVMTGSVQDTMLDTLA